MWLLLLYGAVCAAMRCRAVGARVYKIRETGGVLEHTEQYQCDDVLMHPYKCPCVCVCAVVKASVRVRLRSNGNASMTVRVCVREYVCVCEYVCACVW